MPRLLLLPHMTIQIIRNNDSNNMVGHTNTDPPLTAFFLEFVQTKAIWMLEEGLESLIRLFYILPSLKGFGVVCFLFLTLLLIFKGFSQKNDKMFN